MIAGMAAPTIRKGSPTRIGSTSNVKIIGTSLSDGPPISVLATPGPDRGSDRIRKHTASLSQSGSHDRPTGMASELRIAGLDSFTNHVPGAQRHQRFGLARPKQTIVNGQVLMHVEDSFSETKRKLLEVYLRAELGSVRALPSKIAPRPAGTPAPLPWHKNNCGLANRYSGVAHSFTTSPLQFVRVVRSMRPSWNVAFSKSFVATKSGGRPMTPRMRTGPDRTPSSCSLPFASSRSPQHS